MAFVRFFIFLLVILGCCSCGQQSEDRGPMSPCVGFEDSPCVLEDINSDHPSWYS